MTLEQRVEMLEKELKMVCEHIAQGRVEMDAFQYLVSKLSAEVIKDECKIKGLKSELVAGEKESNTAEYNINFGTDRRVTITDCEGSLRLVLGPLSVEHGSVFIKNATFQNAIYYASAFGINKSEEESAVNNTEKSNVDSHYDELNKKLDYIISLMPALRF